MDFPQEGFPSGDGDVDEDDRARFMACMSGPGVPADPACDQEPDPVTGACCFPYGNCITLTEDVCTENTGTYHGDGTTCAEVSCPKARLFVDAAAPPGGDGLTWATAFQHLRGALARADSLDGLVSEIWVARGTYMPDGGLIPPGGVFVPGGGDRTPYPLIDSLAIYGGFAGDEDPDTFDLADRDFAAHETILSGDLGNNDGPDFANNDENSIGVVWAVNITDAANTILDGFTISGGNTESVNQLYPEGGGLRIINGSPTIANCILKYNDAYASLGGGMFVQNGSPRLTKCTFYDNRSARGAGMFNDNASPTLTDCRFEANGSGDGAGLAHTNGSVGTLARCAFIRNQGSWPQPDGGGAIRCDTGSSLNCIDCRFDGNSSLGNAGAIGLTGATMTVINSTFVGNQSGNSGGAINLINSGAGAQALTLTNCTFVMNVAGNNIGHAIHAGADTLTVHNTIFWLHPANTIYVSPGTPVTVLDIDYCAYGPPPAALTGPGTIIAGPHNQSGNIDVLFERPPDPEQSGWGDTDDDYGDLRPAAGSVVIDAADSTITELSLIVADLAGQPRWVDDGQTPDSGNGMPAFLDVGAYEYMPDCNANGSADPAELAGELIVNPGFEFNGGSRVGWSGAPLSGWGLNIPIWFPTDGGSEPSGQGGSANYASVWRTGPMLDHDGLEITQVVYVHPGETLTLNGYLAGGAAIPDSETATYSIELLDADGNVLDDHTFDQSFGGFDWLAHPTLTAQATTPTATVRYRAVYSGPDAILALHVDNVSLQTTGAVAIECAAPDTGCRPFIYGMGHYYANWAGRPWTYDADAMDKMVEMDATAAFLNFPWIDVQPTEGQPYDWAYSDHLVNTAEARGLEIFAYCGLTPDWALPPGVLAQYGPGIGYRFPPDEQYLDDFNAYFTALAARYAGRVRGYQFWNEPSGCGWVNDNCANGSDCSLFTLWQKRAYDALKAGDSNAIVSAGGFDGDPAGYIQCMYDELAGQTAFDAVSLHPYAAGGPGGPGTGGEGIDYSDLTEVRQVMIDNGDGDKTIWITEYGWQYPTETQREEDELEVMTELKKAKYHYLSFVKPLILNDYPDDGFCCWGLTDENFNSKPAYTAFKNFDKSSTDEAEFFADITAGTAPLEVQFTDVSCIEGANAWLWDFGDGSPLSTEQHPIHTYNTPGSFTVTLTVTGASNQAVIQKPGHISVTTQQPPIVDAGPDLLTHEGSVVSLAPATFTDANASDVHTATINWGDGTIEPGVVDQQARTVSGSHVYADNGAATVTITVEDQTALQGVDSLSVTVLNVAPVASAGSNRTAQVSEEVQLASSDFLYNSVLVASVSDAATFADAGFNNPSAPTTESFNATVDWGDGTPLVTVGAGLSINWTTGGPGTPTTGTLTGSHTYSAPNTYTVTVSVTDDDGGAVQDTCQITVSE